MSQRIKIATLQTKIEFMILSLGGKPDADKAENKFYEGEFENTAKTIKENLKACREKLAERSEKIALFGYQSKERILLDEEIKDMFGACEQGLSYLRDVFKRYQKKNGRKLPQFEIEARSKNIDLLRKNLNLLKDEFQAQLERTQKENLKGKGGGKEKNNKDFVDIFAINGSKSNLDGPYDEEDREMNKDERDLLKQFEENDKELEDIAGAICGALDTLKGTAENIENTIEKQGAMLRAQR